MEVACTDKEKYQRELEKVAATKSAELYRQKFGDEKVDWLFITNYEYDSSPNGDQRR